ncbi:putative dsRNA-binding protein [Deinococcus sp. KNUC1210]|uniref:putative dsRNA-binding protein n=1 Tax=Deinococcus sp. KNUC1210 TaxID=2917691 RepID=UPI001EF0AE8B|nr:putative dsRNA-binding protein [Deinococcus sp. KNUC1210]ULH14908.1 putative dsRNA-binding protein [Deinococcus sp. KNUC1210]
MSGSANPRSDNPKGELIERARALNLGEPVFESVAQGPGHEPWFTTVVSLQGRDLGRGEGRSKRDAERTASHAALQRLMAEPELVAAEPSPRAQTWPIYAEVLSQALLVAHERSDAGQLSEVAQDAARLYRTLMQELGVSPVPQNGRHDPDA